NYLSITNNWRGDIQDITDTLGRDLNFSYDGNGNLLSINQLWNGVTHTWATFSWVDAQHPEPYALNVSGFGVSSAQVIGTFTGDQVPLLRRVGLADGTYVKFLYNDVGQVTRISHYASDSNPSYDNHRDNYMQLDYDNSAGDCPRLTAVRVQADYWTGANGVPAEVVTQFSAAGDKSWAKVTSPDGTIYKEFYYTANWQRGLVSESRVYLNSSNENSDIWEKRTITSWDHDGGANALYPTNPRVS